MFLNSSVELSYLYQSAIKKNKSEVEIWKDFFNLQISNNTLLTGSFKPLYFSYENIGNINEISKKKNLNNNYYSNITSLVNLVNPYNNNFVSIYLKYFNPNENHSNLITYKYNNINLHPLIQNSNISNFKNINIGNSIYSSNSNINISFSNNFVYNSTNEINNNFNKLEIDNVLNKCFSAAYITTGKDKLVNLNNYYKRPYNGIYKNINSDYDENNNLLNIDYIKERNINVNNLISDINNYSFSKLENHKHSINLNNNIKSVNLLIDNYLNFIENINDIKQ